MENSTKDQENKEMPKDPQPSDQVQMHIETVTPDTEKDVQPTPNQGAEAKDDQADQEPKAETAEDETTTSTAGEEQPTESSDEEEQETESDKDESKNDDSEGGNDERDQVETVAP